MASSSAYWNFTESVKSELVFLDELGANLFSELESEDSPGRIADLLSDIKKRLDKLSSQIDAAVPALKKVESALDALPEYED